MRMRRFAVFILILGTGASGCSGPPVDDAAWPQFLGPNRNGKVEDPVAHDWPAGGPEILWRKPVGEGYASPAIVGDRVYLFHRLGDEEIVEALDAGTGETLWRTANPTDFSDHEFGFSEGPRATPTVANGTVFTTGAKRYVQALDAETGERLWGFDAIERYETRRSAFGNGTQPFAVDGLITINMGGRQAGVAAVDMTTGETVWTATDHEAGYASPLLAEIHGLRRLLYFTRVGLVDIDPSDGTVRSTFTWRARSLASVNAAAPVLIGERVFISGSYGTGAVVLDVTPEGFVPVWTSNDVLSNHYVTSIYHEGVLYGLHGRQPLNPSLRAIDPETGEVLWVERRFGSGAILLAGNTLVVVLETGELVLIEASGEEFRPLARASILNSTVRAYPALAAGILYARDQTELIAVDLRPR
jgi:outer membrane protein assembly factor BamB